MSFEGGSVMLSKRVLQSTADEVCRVYRCSLAVADLEGRMSIAAGPGPAEEVTEEFKKFILSRKGKEVRADRYFSRVLDQNEPIFAIAAFGSESAREAGLMFEHMTAILFEQSRSGFGKDDFARRLLSGTILPTDAAGCASELGIRTDMPRVVYAVSIPEGKGIVYKDRLYNRLKFELSDYVVPAGEKTIAVIHEISRRQDVEHRRTRKLEDGLARCIRGYDGQPGRAGCGSIAGSLYELSVSYHEAVKAIEIAGKFGLTKPVHRYDDLLLEELICQLPVPACERFIDRTVGVSFFDSLNQETVRTAAVFIDNTMNASETSRQLYFHRNTLRYRLSHIQVASGLDLRKFKDASLFKMGWMIHRYMKTRE